LQRAYQLWLTTVDDDADTLMPVHFTGECLLTCVHAASAQVVAARFTPSVSVDADESEDDESTFARICEVCARGCTHTANNLQTMHTVPPSTVVDCVHELAHVLWRVLHGSHLMLAHHMHLSVSGPDHATFADTLRTEYLYRVWLAAEHNVRALTVDHQYHITCFRSTVYSAAQI
jgi:hypothetical protein